MRELPTGTVTFLFTDLEGSTRLWEQHPDAMRDALARHDAILRNAIEQQHGHVVKTTGDGVHAAFATAQEAVTAAVDAQLALHEETWDKTGPLKVRIGLHTGEGEHRDGDYYGTAVNRAARVGAAAHGGQILCSLGTEQLVRDALPAGTSLADLGEHRLRDLGRPERLFQLSHAVLPTEFPPVRGLDSYPSNLPLQLTSFVGRERELAEIATALDDARIVTLTGVGGVGKTRLAVHLAAELLPRFRDGAWFADLAPVRDASAVADTVAAALGLQPEPGQLATTRLPLYVKSMELLLVVDNCEHVLDQAAELISTITHAGPKVRVLATSREGLAVSGERILAVGSLPIPASDADVDAPAAQLFVERAAAAGSTDLDDRTHIVQICRRLDGVPLALELAAARARSMSVADINERLDRRFRLLTGGPRDALSRHQTLRQAIDWSYELLSPDEQLALDRLSVFAGGFDLTAAEAVVGADGIDPFEVVDLVGHLVEKSLVVRDEQMGAGRYRLLETIRQYAQERLEAREDTQATRRRHMHVYADLMEQVRSGLTGADEVEWSRRVTHDIENLRSALATALATPEVETATAMTTATYSGVGFTMPLFAPWVDSVLALPGLAASPRAPRVLAWAAFVKLANGEVDRAVELADAALAANVELGLPDDFLVRGAVSTLGMFIGDFERSMVEGRAASDLARAAGDDYFLNMYLIQLSATHGFAGDVDECRRLSEEAAEAARRCGTLSGLAGALTNLGWIVRETEPALALATLEEAIAVAQRVGTPQPLGYAAANTVVLHARAGRSAAALANAHLAIEVSRQRADRQQLGHVMVFLGMALVAAGSPEPAAVLAGAGRTMIWSAVDISPDGHLLRAMLDDALGSGRVDELITQGAAMDDDRAVELARRALDDAFGGGDEDG